MRLRNQNQGFTLIELLILVVILTIFLSAVLPLVVKNVYLNYQAKLKLKAQQAALVKIEELRGQDFNTLTSGTFVVSSIPKAIGTVEISHDIDGNGSNETDIVAAAAKVSYPIRGEQKDVVIRTYISKTGIGK